MFQYLLPFLLTLALSAILTPVIRKLSLKWGFFDYPSPRKIHQRPVPRIGGLAIFLSFWLVVLFYLILKPESLSFVSEKIWSIDKNLFGVITGAFLIFAIGILDDIKKINPYLKLFFSFLAASLVAFFGIKIWWFSNPFGQQIILGFFSPIFVILWIVLISNVVNLLDGLDGLATGVVFIAALVLFFLSKSPSVNQPATALLCLILAGASLGFLPFNTNPAKIFLGDGGAYFLGFMIAIFAIISGGKVATAALVLGVPILDAAWVLLRRIFLKKPPFLPDKSHLHHRMLALGLSQHQVVLILYGISICFGAIALYSQTLGKFWAFIALLILMIIIIGSLLILETRRKVEKESI